MIGANPLDRRTAILGAAGLIGVAATAGLLTPAAPVPPIAPYGLRCHAARRGMSFGCEITSAQVAAGGAAMAAVVAEADMVVPSVEMKWGVTEQVEGRPDYSVAETVAAFAKAHGLRLRGHAGFWYLNLPNWARPELAGPGAEALILARVTDVVGHFKGRVFEWDVVNEAIEPRDNQAGALRLAPFGRPVGAGYIADCFHAAHDADPAAWLFYNDFGVEYDTELEDQRRAGVIGLLRELKRHRAPVHGLGLQSHIGVGRRFNAAKYRAFLAEVAALGLKIRITEFDVADNMAPADIASRDAAVANEARRFLDTAFDERAVEGLLCWGLSDRDSWLRQQHPVRVPADRYPERPLPLDDELRRKPLWQAIATAFDAAPSR